MNIGLSLPFVTLKGARFLVTMIIIASLAGCESATQKSDPNNASKTTETQEANQTQLGTLAALGRIRSDSERMARKFRTAALPTWREGESAFEDVKSSYDGVIDALVLGIIGKKDVSNDTGFRDAVSRLEANLEALREEAAESETGASVGRWLEAIVRGAAELYRQYRSLRVEERQQYAETVEKRLLLSEFKTLAPEPGAN